MKTLLDQMRCNNSFTKSIVSVLLLTFTSLVAAPAAAAVRDASEQPARAAPTDEERLTQAVEKTRSTLMRIEAKLAKAEDHANDRAELKALRKEMDQLDLAVRKNFDDLGKHLRDKKLPEVILKRHDEAAARYQRELSATLAGMDAVNGAKDDTERTAKVKQARTHLEGMKLRRSHQPYNPNDLNPVFRSNPDNKPRTDPREFTEAGLYSNPLPKLSALGAFKFDGLPGATDPAYLAETPEITLTQAIRDKAAALNHDPVKVYHWVRNNVEWLPTWGAFQNADMTLTTLRGNSMDIASLTLALLRASGIPARYVHGTIDVPAGRFTNWAGDFADVLAAQEYASTGGIATGAVVSGGQIAKMRMEHVWVEAAIDYHPSRGAVNREADAWVEMDPSYKQYEYQRGLDVGQISGIDPQAVGDAYLASGTVNTSEGWIQGLDPTILENVQLQANVPLQNHIAGMNDPTVADVIGWRKHIVQEYPALPSALPNRIVVKGARYATLPDRLRNFMTFAFGADLLGDLNDPLRTPWTQLNNERITLSFRPATAADEQALLSLLPAGDNTDLSLIPRSIPSYLIAVIPELKLNGQVIKSGAPMRLGEELDLIYQVTTPLETMPAYTYKVIAGSYLALASVGQNVAVSHMNALKSRLEATKAKLDTQDLAQIAALTRDDVLGDMFHVGVLGYFNEFNAMSRIMALQQRAGHTLAIGYGSFGYEPEVSYFFGFPRAISVGGAVMNVRLGNYVTSHTNDRTATLQFNQQLGLLSSALEHIIPEQMFVTPANPGEAVSAVKALMKAQIAGQRIYHITADNMATALANIHQDPLVIEEIRAGLAVGREVYVHTDPISVPGWAGAGYVMLDPQTGVGAWKIAGGMNGGVLQYVEDNSASLSFTLAGAGLEIRDLVRKIGNPRTNILDALDALSSFIMSSIVVLTSSAVTHASDVCLTKPQSDALLGALGNIGQLGLVSQWAGPQVYMARMLGYMTVFFYMIHFIGINKALDDCRLPKN